MVYDLLEIFLFFGEDLGDWQLFFSILEEVVVEVELIFIKFKNDMLEFDVRVFIIRLGVVVEEVLK